MTDTSTLNSITTPPAEPLAAGDGRAGPRSKRFLDRVADVLADLTEVKVVTLVGDIDVTLKVTSGGKTTETEIGTATVTSGAIVTIYKIIDGDVTTTISPDRLTDSVLLAKHEEQLQKSLKVLPDHLKTLVDIVKSLDDV